MNDTIVAISTPVGESAIGVARLSGNPLEMLKKVFEGNLKENSHSLSFGKIIDPVTKQAVDEVVVGIFLNPHSYTGEDVVEISCHGNPFILKEILDLFISLGARMAEPGEFTQRAYLSGKMDLSRAEAVDMLIHAHTRYARAQALGHLEGRFSEKISGVHSNLLDLLALVEVAIDHSDLNEELQGYDLHHEQCSALIEQIEQLLSTSKSGKMIESGMKIAIVGAPNSGKSSLMNQLLKEDRVIVSDIEGTTRDTIEDELNIKGIPVRLIDTAGVRETDDFIEQKGIERTRAAIESADLRIMIFDGSRDLTAADEAIFNLTKDSDTVYLLNKTDLKQAVDLHGIKRKFGVDIIPVSVIKGEGISALEQAVYDYYFSFGYDPATDVLVANARQEGLLRDAKNHLKTTLDAIERHISEEFVASDLRKALVSLEEIVGKTTGDAILERIFSKFCIGK